MANPERPRVAIVFPSDAVRWRTTRLDDSRFAETAAALRAAGLDPVAAPYCDEAADEIHSRLLTVDGVLVWVNPVEGGRDRSKLNALLREVAATGVVVSTHPDVIDKLGTKEVLYRTRTMGWGTDVRLYASAYAMRAELPASLAKGPRVLKQIRGQSGDGVWKVELADAAGSAVLVRHAKRGGPEERVTLGAFVDRCAEYFLAGGGMIDQAYQERLTDGMIRCYLVGNRVEGFGEQLVNMLYPPPVGQAVAAAPEPGPRQYFPPTRPDFQPLKAKLEQEWIGELCTLIGLDRSQLPVLWDADFLLGPKDASGADTYVLCEINVSSVYPYPESARSPIATEIRARIANRR